MHNINILICYLYALDGYLGDIHYSVHGGNFYAKHLFADRIRENIHTYIDQLKEICLLGNEIEPLPSGEYYVRSTDSIPARTDDDKTNFIHLQNLIVKTLALIEEIDNITVGEANLIGNIAQDLQQNLGLLNLQIKE